MTLPFTASGASRIPVGISACLLGEEVRYDGTHKRSDYCRDELSRHFDFLPVCPEMAIGLGAPRPTIRLVASDASGTAWRAIQSVEPPRDVSDALSGVADNVLASHPDLCGFILTERSPSCGVFAVKTWDRHGQLLHTNGRGLFAARLLAQQPLLPVEEAGRLSEPRLRDNFVLRVYVWHEWHHTVLPVLDTVSLATFWTRYQAPVLAQDEMRHRQITQLLAYAGSDELPATANRFFILLMQALMNSPEPA